MGKGSIEAKYGLIGLKGLKMFSFVDLKLVKFLL